MIVVALVFVPARAWGAQAHAYSSVFAGEGSKAGLLELEGSGVAIDDATGDVYVADTGNDRVDDFEADGTFVRAWGWGVGDGVTEALQTCTSTCYKGIAGPAAGEFQAPRYIAVDNACSLHMLEPGHKPDPLTGVACEEYDPSNGDVYVGEELSAAVSLVTKFTATGGLVSSWGDNGTPNGKGEPTPNGQLVAKNEGAFAESDGITTDTAGDLWVLTSGTSTRTLFEFEPSSGFITKSEPALLPTNSPPGIAINSHRDLYAASNGPELEKLSPSGELLGVISVGTKYSNGSAEFAREFAGLTVDPLHDFLYLDEREGGDSVRVFSPQCEPNLEQITHPINDCKPTETFGEAHVGGMPGLAGIGVDSRTGTVYVADGDRVLAFGATLEADVTAATNVRSSSASVNGEVSAEGGEITGCSVQYGETESYGESTPCLDESGDRVGTPENPVKGALKVHGELSGLAGGGVYHARLHVLRAGAGREGGVLYSEDEQLETLPTPTIDKAAATEVGELSATLTAKIDPVGLEARYRFEYDTRSYVRGEASHGVRVPVSEAVVGSGHGGVDVSQAIGGLSAGTTYYFRVLASNHCNPEAPAEVCVSESPVHTFVYLPEPVPQDCANEQLRAENESLALPDCRAYELVTPPDKNGAVFGDVFSHPETGVSEDGLRVTSVAIQCTAGALSCVGDRDTQGSPYGFERGEAGWVSTPLSPPAPEFYAVTRWGALPESGSGIFTAVTSSNGVEDLYEGSPGSYVEIGPVEEHPEPHTFYGVHGITQDRSHIIYNSIRSAWAFDTTDPQGNSRLYEYVGSGNSQPLLVGVTGGEGSHELVSRCGTLAGEDGDGGQLSADGESVFFIAEGRGGCFGSGPVNEHVEVPVNELFDRVDGEGAAAHTVAISKPSPSECGGGGAPGEVACREAEGEPGSAEFQGASEDGSIVFFTDTQQLTGEASEDKDSSDSAVEHGCSLSRGVNGCNLYLYDFNLPEGGRLVDVSGGDVSGLGPEVQGVMAVSPDGSHVYFVARGVLTGAANAQGEGAREGAENLYVYERDAAYPGGRVVFIASVAGEEGQWVQGPRSFGANVTPDGGFLVFASTRPLTGDASGSANQLYRYDAVSGVLLRVSVGERGFGDNGNEGGGSRLASHQDGAPPTAQARTDLSMSNSGAFLFFESASVLAPGAAAGAENVYEWTEDGAGVGVSRCGLRAGCVSLIAAGVQELLGVDGSGENVFFATNEALVAGDIDTDADFYDARVDGGFPQPPPQLPCEVSEACHPRVPPAVEGAVGSLVFSGPGNPLFSPPPGPHGPSAAQVSARALARALRVCRKDKPKKKRLACETQARKKYGAKKKAKGKAKKSAKRSTTTSRKG